MTRGRKPSSIVAGSIDAIPVAPSWLCRYGKAEWKHVACILVERQHLTDADLGTLAAYADAYSDLVKSSKLIQLEGMIIATDKGPRKHPAISIQNNARNQVRQLAAELGLTPISRSRPTVRDTSNDDADDNPLVV